MEAKSAIKKIIDREDASELGNLTFRIIREKLSELGDPKVKEATEDPDLWADLKQYIKDCIQV